MSEQPLTANFSATRAREVAASAEAPEAYDAIGKTIGRLRRLIDPGPEADAYLTPEQRDAITRGINTLLVIHERTVPTGDHAFVIRRLFTTYFDHQQALAETTAAHYLRVLGDDYAIQTGFDLGRAWEIYQETLEAAQAWPR